MKRQSCLQLAQIVKEIAMEADAGWTGHGKYSIEVTVHADYVTKALLVKGQTSMNIAK